MRTKIITEKCGCCGNEFNTEVLVSSYVNDRGLDGKPLNNQLLKRVHLCPNCNYVSFDMEEKVTEEQKKIVYSKEYKEIFQNEDKEKSKYDAVQMLSLTEHQKIDSMLQYVWYMEFTGENDIAKKYRTELVQLLEKNMSNKPRVEQMMMYIDSLRQLREFEKAKEMLSAIHTSMQHNKEKYPMVFGIYEYEKKLVDSRDSDIHFQSEVIV